MDRARLEQALINADKAGDTEAATALAKALRDMNADSVGARLAKGAISDPITGLAQLAYNALPKDVQSAGNRFNNMLADAGLPIARIPEGGLNELVRQQESQYQAPEGLDVARIAGNVLSPVNLIPGGMAARAATSPVGRISAGAGLGALSGAAQPVVNQDYTSALGTNVALGAGLGGALSGVGQAVAKAVKPSASVNPDVAMLKSLGVDITPGQALGGAASRTEQKLTSVPFLGSQIEKRRGTALDQFSNAMFNKAGTPIGFKTQKVGLDAVGELDEAVSKAYKSAIDATPGVKVDDQFLGNVIRLEEMAKDIATDENAAKALSRQIGLLLNKVTKSDQVLPDTWKELDAMLGKAMRETKNYELKSGLRQLQSEWRDMAGRSNPEQRKLFKSADAAYKNLLILEKAAGKAAKQDGVFTPNQLYRSAEKFAGSKSQVRQQTAPFLAEARAAENVLGNTVPNSGTFDRAALGGLLGGAGLAIDPTFLFGPLAGAAMYSKLGNKALTGLVSSRPDFADPISQFIGRSSPYAGLIAPQIVE